MRHGLALGVTATAILLGSQVAASGQNGDAKAAKSAAAKAKFSEVYRLDDKETMRAVRRPQTSLRVAHFRTNPGLGVPMFSDRIQIYFRWKDGALASPVWVGTGDPLRDLAASLLHLPVFAIEGERDLLKSKINADFITRDGLKPADLVPSLETILNRDLNLKVKLTLAEVERPCVVVTGKYKYLPAPGVTAPKAGAMDHLEIYESKIGDGIGTPTKPDIKSVGNADYLFGMLSDHTGHRFINESSTDADKAKVFGWHISSYAYPEGVSEAGLDAILKNLSAQTGLKYEKVKRQVTVLKIERSQ